MKFEVGKVYKSSILRIHPDKNKFKEGEQVFDCDWVLPPNSKFILLEYIESVVCYSYKTLYNLKILFEGKIGWIYSTKIDFLIDQS